MLKLKKNWLKRINKKTWLQVCKYLCIFCLTLIFVQFVNPVQAHDLTLPKENLNHIKTIWMLVSACLVFFMNAGFAMVEAGFCRTNNAVNILAKNLIVFCVSALAYWMFGFALMFGNSGSESSFFGQAGFFFEIPFPSITNPQPILPVFSNFQEVWEGRSFSALFFFQCIIS